MSQTLGQLIAAQRPQAKSRRKTNNTTRLSPKQRIICDMVALAMDDNTIAEQMFVTNSTIKAQLFEVRKKLKLTEGNARVALARFVWMGGNEENPFPRF